MAEKPSRYLLRGRRVLEHVRAHADRATRHEFDELIEQLQRDALSGAAEIHPLKIDEFRNSYTVPFDNALLAYQVGADFPWMRLLYVRWLPKDDDET